LCFSKRSQLSIPLGLEFVSDETIVGIHFHEAATCEIGLVACPLDLARGRPASSLK
jgi:hypothetical protein